MTKEIEMYCSFNREGQIIPLQFRVEDENGELQTFKVKRYKEPKERLETQRGYNGVTRKHVSRLDYAVVIEINGFERTVTLLFDLMNHKWSIMF